MAFRNKQRRKSIKKIFIFTALISSFFAVGGTAFANEGTYDYTAMRASKTDTVLANSINYNDWRSGEYWSNDMLWAIDNGLIQGYINKEHPTDKRKGVGNWLNPYGRLTEAQMLAVVFRYTHSDDLVNTKPEMDWWASTAYQLAKKYKLPVKATLTNRSPAAKVVSRGELANSLATLYYGKPVTSEQAVQFMYDSGLSNGKTGAKTYEDFGVNDQLARVHIVTFMKRYDDLLRSGNTVELAPPSQMFIHPELSKTSIQAKTPGTLDYNYGYWFTPAKRYLFGNDDGSKINLLHVDSRNLTIHTQTFSNTYEKLSETKMEMELPLFGGFHAGDDGNYYIVYGQENQEESDAKTVYRVVKYDASWNKLAELDIKNVNVVTPFYASNVTMDSRQGKLIIHSSREMYRSSDGLRHQANISFLIDLKNMTLLDKGRNFVSHSMATYAQFDGEKIVYVDHGDGNPRSVFLQVDQGGRMDYLNLIGIPGKSGDNYTGTHVGGLETAASNYLVVGSHQPHKRDVYNVFLSVAPKTFHSDPKTVWLTNYEYGADASVHETHISKINENKFVVLWKEVNWVPYGDESSPYSIPGENILHYAVVDGDGKILSKPKKLEGVPAPGNLKPLVKGDTVTWYYSEPEGRHKKEDVIDFYTLHVGN